MDIEILQPDDYDFGAWRVTIKLNDEEIRVCNKKPLSFKIPKLNYRNIIPDEGYRIVGFFKDEAKFGGLFKDGIWCGHVYSNGIAEEKNPVVIESVKISLEEHVKQSLEYGYYFGTIADNTHYFAHFGESISQIRLLNNLDINEADQKATLNNLLFVNCITAMETYLSDAYINTVLKDQSLIRKLIESAPELKQRKVELSDIFSRFKNLTDEVSKYLIKIIYHNLSKIKPMYKDVLDVNFPDDISNMMRAIQTRHDIVHRNGKSQNGDIIKLSKENIESHLELIESFIGHIESQLAKKI